MNMSMRIAMISSGLGLATAAVFGCSDDATPTPAEAADAGSSGSSGADGSSGSSGSSGTSGTPDGGSASLNGCRNYVDRSAEGASRIVQWDVTLFQQDVRCMKIKKGQKVTFATSLDGGTAADFSAHPLTSQGGDTPNPVETALDKDSGEVSFGAAGVFGYICGIHPSMTGAVLVTE